ncbi:MAG TPA: hypothetical protein VLG10_17750 [Methylomirabilota bacterium]|nr:hypothetical protein [Methylomirabilota bacterium]
MRPRRWILLAVVVGLSLAGRDPAASAQAVQPGTPAPEITAGPWINSASLTLAGLRGRVVLVEFWTYG